MRRFLRDNSLSLGFGLLFVGTLVAQAFVGHANFNQEQVAHHSDTVSLWRYVTSSSFGSDVMENWQSEYLQFTLFILGTVWLLQRGSPEARSSTREGERATATRTSALMLGMTRRGGRAWGAGGPRSTPTRC